MLTRQETLEYLSGYSSDPQQIQLVLLELGEDPDGDKFPDDIVERAEKVFEAIGSAKAKAIASSGSQATEIISQQTGAIAFTLLEQQGISLPIEVIVALAQSKVQESIELADRLSELQRRTFATRLTHNNVAFAQQLMGLSDNSAEIIDVVLGDEAQSQYIAAATPTKQLNIAAFLAGVDARAKSRSQLEQRHVEQVKALPQQDPRQYVKAFLAARKSNG